MPPIQPSLRGSLLTGASALALAISGAGAQAQDVSGHSSQGPIPQEWSIWEVPATPFDPRRDFEGTPGFDYGSRGSSPRQWAVWAEGALFSAAGGGFNIPSIPGLGAPLTSLNPRSGLEGAFGIDYRFANAPLWHFVFDFRYGRSRTVSSNSSNPSSESTPSFFTSSGFLFEKNTNTANSSVTEATEKESHLATDFMIGRDVGMGADVPELQVGIRFADLTAKAQAQESGQSTTSTTTFFSGSPIATSSSTTSSLAFATWSSRFFGAGPRVAVTDNIPIVSFLTFDYGVGVAELFGQRTFNSNMTSTTGSSASINSSALAFVFNADGWVALGCWLTPNAKLSGGIRGDLYEAAFTTYDINTGGLQDIGRGYWGPFLRLTGTF
jgi:hypothetical protein